MRLRQALVMLAPFALVALGHYLRFTSLAPITLRGRVLPKTAEKRGWGAASGDSGPRASGRFATDDAISAATTSATPSPSVGKKKLWIGMKGALSSEAATQKILESAGLTAEAIEGLGEVTTAEEFVKKLPSDQCVWLTFSNMAYLHFAQNWYMQVGNDSTPPSTPLHFIVAKAACPHVDLHFTVALMPSGFGLRLHSCPTSLPA